MSKQPLNLLFKNAFRVFGKTKLLASELTILTLVSTTVLTATSLANVNLENSKKLIENNSFPMEFSINEKQQSSIDTNAKKIIGAEITKPYYLDYLNTNNNFLSSYQSSIGSNNSLEWMTNSNNNKLAYYYVTTPNATGSNLLKVGPNGSSFASIVLNQNQTYTDLLNHTAEIFSFISNIDNNLNAIPSSQGNISSNFDIRQIIYDSTKNVAAGISDFGYAQVLGFDLNKKLSVSHNVVDTKNENQIVVQSFKNNDGAYAVPNEMLLWLGEQNEQARKFYISNAETFPSPTWNFDSFATILSDLGNNINSLGGSKTTWTPYELTIDFSKPSSETKFLKDFLTSSSNEFAKLREDINKYHYFDFDITQISDSDLNNVSAIYSGNDNNKIKTSRYLKTVAWLPDYLNNDEVQKAIIDVKTKWSAEISTFVNKLIDPKSPWNNLNGDLTKLLSPLSKEIETNLSDLTSQKLFEITKQIINNTSFNIINKKEFLNIYQQNQNIFNDLYNSKQNVTVDEYIDFINKYLDICLEKYILIYPTLNSFYNYKYTLIGALRQFGFEYQKDKNFSTTDSTTGNSYIISEYSNDKIMNNVVDNQEKLVNVLDSTNDLKIYNQLYNLAFLSSLFWTEKTTPFDVGYIVSYDGNYETNLEDYIKKNLILYKGHYLPRYELFVNLDLLNVIKKLYTDVEWNASTTQLDGLVGALYPFTKISNSELNQKIYDEKILPLFYDWLHKWNISSISQKESNIEIQAIYFFGVSQPNGTPLTGNLVSKTSYSTVVSSDFMDNNKYDEKYNPNGKMIYPDLSAYENALRLPYIDLSNSNNPENWFTNPLTGNIEYYRDFKDWFSKVPSRFKISLNGVSFLIIDSGISADFLYPVANEQMLLVNSSSSAVLYMNDAGYSRALINSNGVTQNKYFALRYVGDNKLTDWYYKHESLKKLNNWIDKNISSNSYYKAYKVKDSHQPNKLLYTRMSFIDNFQRMIIGITLTISIIVLILSLIFICTLIRSIIKQNRQMFGVCLANGINRHILALSFLPFSLIPGAIAGFLGYLFGNLFQPLFNGMVNQYWTLPINSLGWMWWLFLLIPLFIVGLLFLISYIVVIWTLRKSAIDILATPSGFRMNVLVEKSNWLFKHFRARTAFKFTYIFGNITRFLILTSIVTSFITLSSITIGSIGVFDTALEYTQRNKNYNFAFDLFSPTIQGGFYDIKPVSLIGTSSKLQPSLYKEAPITTKFANPLKYGQININQQIFGTEKTINNWINNHSISRGVNQYLFDIETTSKWIIGAQKDSQLLAEINVILNTDVLLVKPLSIYINNNEVEKITNNEQPIEMVYYFLTPTYDTRVYQDYWTNPYAINGLKTYFDTLFYPSFNIVPDIQQDVTFFTGKFWVKTLLDFDINLGAMSINPWMFAKSLMPSGITSLSEKRNEVLLNRAVDFYKYLDDVENKKIIDNDINYKNYYESMDFNNKPYLNKNSFAYNPINIDGSAFKTDKDGNIVFDENKSILVPRNTLYSQYNDFILNVPVASKGLPTFELKPETIRMWTYISTNFLNPVYKKWGKDILKVENENLNYVLGLNTVPTNNLSEKSIINEDSTYTYLNSVLKHQNSKTIRNDSVKVIGIKPNAYGSNKEPMVNLYDSNEIEDKSKTLNHLLENKVDGMYPLVINEVVNKYYKINIGDVLTLNITNGLFRYKRVGQGLNPNIEAKFKVVGITTSKSEMQFYTNQLFANEILGFNSSEDNANQLYEQGTIPFNGLFTATNDPSIINNIAPLYAPLGINPAFPLCVKTTSLRRNDNEQALMFAWSELNDIFKFNIIGDEPFNKSGLNNVIDRIVNIGNMNNYSQSFMTIGSEIAGVDAKFASNIISGTIDSTVANIQLIAIIALLPTLFIIITLMATMIITESRRLIAIMKVLGFGDWFNTFNFMFVYIVVLLLGLLLAIPLTYGLLAGLKALGFGIFNIIINPVAPWWIYLASAGVAGLLFVLLFIFVKSKMKKINLSQAISFG